MTLIEEEFTNQFNMYLSINRPAAVYHRGQLLKHAKEFDDFYSDETCFSCLVRRPRYRLPCKHLVCQTCVNIFGCQKEDRLFLESCLLCAKETGGFFLRQKPATAAIRILSIDGGGGKAPIPLSFLLEIEKAVRLPFPVQHHFDVVYGTSSGIITILAS